MIKSLLILLLLLLGACSMEPAPNSWKYKSTSYFESYKQNFLYDKEILAQADLESAETYAKRGADVTQLASIYLGKCALDIAVGIDGECKKYQEIEELVSCPKIKNYYKMLQKDFDDIDVKMLPLKYQDFIAALAQNDARQANQLAQKIDDPVSQLLAISLLGDEVSRETLLSAIETLSFYGYKKGVVFGLSKLETKTTDPEEKELVTKKIKLLQ